jgi:hypothetical protein
MIQQTEVMGKSNPDGLDFSLCVARFRLSKPGVEKVTCASKGKALWKEPTDFSSAPVSLFVSYST